MIIVYVQPLSAGNAQKQCGGASMATLADLLGDDVSIVLVKVLLSGLIVLSGGLCARKTPHGDGLSAVVPLLLCIGLFLLDSKGATSGTFIQCLLQSIHGI